MTAEAQAHNEAAANAVTDGDVELEASASVDCAEVHQRIEARKRRKEELRAEVERLRAENERDKQELHACLVLAQARIAELEEDRPLAEGTSSWRINQLRSRKGMLLVFVVLVVLSGVFFGGTRVNVEQSQTQVMHVSPEFAGQLHDSGSYYALTEAERREVDRARREGR